MKTFRTTSSGETRRLGEQLARRIATRFLPAARQKTAVVIALVGELGSGKTTFVQGFLRGLGVRRKTNSPTFVIFRRFRLSDKLYTPNLTPFRNVYHIDAYRIQTPSELLRLGLGDIIRDPRNIVLLEWAEKMRRLLPKRTVKINFEHDTRESERFVTVR